MMTTGTWKFIPAETEADAIKAESIYGMTFA